MKTLCSISCDWIDWVHKSGLNSPWCGRVAESLVTEALFTDRWSIWLCSHHAPYQRRRGHTNDPLLSISNKPPELFPWPSWLQNYWPWCMTNALDFKLRTTQWFTGSVVSAIPPVGSGWQMAVPWRCLAITQSQRQSRYYYIWWDPNRLDSHATCLLTL